MTDSEVKKKVEPSLDAMVLRKRRRGGGRRGQFPATLPRASFATRKNSRDRAWLARDGGTRSPSSATNTRGRAPGTIRWMWRTLTFKRKLLWEVKLCGK